MKKKDYLLSLPHQKIPKEERWMKNDGKGGPEFELKHGISLRDLGFGWEALFDDGPDNTRVFPPEFPGYLWCNPERYKWKITFGFLVPDENFLFAQNWIDRDRLFELIDEPNHVPVLIHQFGTYHWCSNGAHRVVTAKIEGRGVLALKRSVRED